MNGLVSSIGDTITGVTTIVVIMNDNDDTQDNGYISVTNHTLFCGLNIERPGTLFLAGFILRSSQISTSALNRSQTCGLEICSYNQHIHPEDLGLWKGWKRSLILWLHIFIENGINSFHTTSLLLYHLKTSENLWLSLWFSNVFKEHRKKLMPWNELQ